MLRRVKGQKGQANFGEYVLILFLVMGAASVMTVFVKRALQARVRDAGHLVFDSAVITANYINAIDDQFGWVTGNIYSQYEPYYMNTESTIVTDARLTERLDSAIGTTSGIFTKEIDEETSVGTTSTTAPPAQAR